VAPPLIADASDIEEILATLAHALDETLRHAKQNGFV